jgi:hypothetical protein
VTLFLATLFYLPPGGGDDADQVAISPLPSPAAFAPGRFRLLLLSLLLFFGGTAAATGTRLEPLIDFILLAVMIVTAVLDLRVPGQHRLVFTALAFGAILLSVVDLNVRIRQLPMIAGTVVGLFAGFVVWLAYASVMRPQRPVGNRIHLAAR